MTLTLLEVVAAVRIRRASLVAEMAGYVVLGMADGLVFAPREIRPEEVTLGEDGSIRVGGGTAAPAIECERALRALLDELLRFGSSPTPALARISQKPAVEGVETLLAELEAALIPVNRAAARRALARLYRETLRAAASVELDVDGARTLLGARGASAASAAPPVAPPPAAEPLAVAPLPVAPVVAAPPPAAPPRVAEIASEPAWEDAGPLLLDESRPPANSRADEAIAVDVERAPSPSALPLQAEILTLPEPAIARAAVRAKRSDEPIARTPVFGTVASLEAPAEEERTERAPAIDTPTAFDVAVEASALPAPGSDGAVPSEGPASEWLSPSPPADASGCPADLAAPLPSPEPPPFEPPPPVCEIHAAESPVSGEPETDAPEVDDLEIWVSVVPPSAEPIAVANETDPAEAELAGSLSADIPEPEAPPGAFDAEPEPAISAEFEALTLNPWEVEPIATDPAEIEGRTDAGIGPVVAIAPGVEIRRVIQCEPAIAAEGELPPEEDWTLDPRVVNAPPTPPRPPPEQPLAPEYAPARFAARQSDVTELLAGFGVAEPLSERDLCRDLKLMAGVDLTPHPGQSASPTPPPVEVVEPSRSGTASNATRWRSLVGALGLIVVLALGVASGTRARATGAAELEKPPPPCRASLTVTDVPAGAEVRLRPSGTSNGVVARGPDPTFDDLACGEGLELTVAIADPAGTRWQRIPVLAAELDARGMDFTHVSVSAAPR